MDVRSAYVISGGAVEVRDSRMSQTSSLVSDTQPQRLAQGLRSTTEKKTSVLNATLWALVKGSALYRD